MLRRRPKNNPQVDRKLRPRNSIFPKEKQAVLRTEAPQKLFFRALRTGIAAGATGESGGWTRLSALPKLRKGSNLLSLP